MATIQGTSGDDSLIGGNSDASGNGGDDTIHGGAGNDRLDGRNGTDHLYGDDGDDTILVGTAPTNLPRFLLFADGGAGHDTLDLLGDHRFQLLTNALGGGIDLKEFDPVTQTFHIKGLVSNIEALTVETDGAWIDLHDYSTPLTVKTTGADTLLWTGPGDDVIDVAGSDGNVGYFGGNDKITFSKDSGSLLIGGLSAGHHDVVVTGFTMLEMRISWSVTFSNDATFDMRSNVLTAGDTVFHLPEVTTVYEDTGAKNFTVWGDEYNDHIEVNGGGSGGGSNLIDGGAGSDTIIVFGQATLAGGSGNDNIDGGSGNGWYFGDGSLHDSAAMPATGIGGSDFIYAGEGNDHIYGYAQFLAPGTLDGGDMIYAGLGSDYVNGNAGDDVIRGGGGSDRLYGGAGDDLIYGDHDDITVGIAGNDHINGNKGNDTIWGDAGNDSLNGGQDNDQLHGGDGDDTVSGDLGDDTIAGGAGYDRMIGGVGRDLFQFTDSIIDANFTTSGVNANQTDVIMDFSSVRNTPLGQSDDMIRLAFHPAAILTGSADDFAHAAVLAQQLFTQHAGTSEVAAIQVGSDTFLLFSANGADTIDSAIKLMNIANTAIGSDIFV